MPRPAARTRNCSSFSSCSSGEGERGGLDKRLVPLEVEDGVGVEAGGDLGHAVGAAGVVGAGFHHPAAEALHRRDDAWVVRGHDNGGGTLRLASSLVDVLDE